MIDGADVIFTGNWTLENYPVPVKDVHIAGNMDSIDGKAVKAGQELVYSITYINTTDSARDVVITDTIPANTTYVDGSADNGGLYDAVSKKITWTKNVNKDTEINVSFKVKFNDDVKGEEITNKGRVSDGLIDVETNTTKNHTPTPPKKDVFKDGDTVNTINNKLVKAGDILVYAISYKNTTGETRDVEIGDTIPDNATYVDGSADNGGQLNGNEVKWNLTNVASGSTVKVSFKVKVNDDVNGEKITNKGNVKDGFNDVETNTTKNHTSTTPSKDVFKNGGTVSINNQVVKAGDELTYVINYKNTTGEKRNVVISDTIPANTTYVDGSADHGGQYSNGKITWTINDVNDNQTLVLKFNVKVDENINGQEITNSAKVTDGVIDVDTNTTKNFSPSTPVKDVFTGNSATSINNHTVTPNQELKYVITYKNTTGTNQDVVITNLIPAHTTYVTGSADNGGTFDGTKLTWTKTLVHGETYEVSFKVKVDANVNGEKIINVGHVKDGAIDVDTNKTTNPTPVKPPQIVKIFIQPNNPSVPNTSSFNDTGLYVFGLLCSIGLLAFIKFTFKDNH